MLRGDGGVTSPRGLLRSSMLDRDAEQLERQTELSLSMVNTEESRLAVDELRVSRHPFSSMHVARGGHSTDGLRGEQQAMSSCGPMAVFGRISDFFSNSFLKFQSKAEKRSTSASVTSDFDSGGSLSARSRIYTVGHVHHIMHPYTHMVQSGQQVGPCQVPWQLDVSCRLPVSMQCRQARGRSCLDDLPRRCAAELAD